MEKAAKQKSGQGHILEYSNVDFQKQKCYKVIDGLRNMDKGLILEALTSAEIWHEGQERREIKHTPYIIHIYRVVTILVDELGIKDSVTLAAATLHDVIEDCGASKEELTKKFGEKIADIVGSDSQNFFPNRKSYMEHFGKAQREVKLLKIADRIDNLRTLPPDWKKEKEAQYVIETEKYVLPISNEVSKPAFDKLESLIHGFKKNEEFVKAYKELSERRGSDYEDTEEHKPNPDDVTQQNA